MKQVTLILGIMLYQLTVVVAQSTSGSPPSFVQPKDSAKTHFNATTKPNNPQKKGSFQKTNTSTINLNQNNQNQSSKNSEVKTEQFKLSEKDKKDSRKNKTDAGIYQYDHGRPLEK